MRRRLPCRPAHARWQVADQDRRAAPRLEDRHRKDLAPQQTENVCRIEPGCLSASSTRRHRAAGRRRFCSERRAGPDGTNVTPAAARRGAARTQEQIEARKGGGRPGRGPAGRDPEPFAGAAPAPETPGLHTPNGEALVATPEPAVDRGVDVEEPRVTRFAARCTNASVNPCPTDHGERTESRPRAPSRRAALTRRDRSLPTCEAPARAASFDAGATTAT